MASLYVNEELPTTSEAAIREFNDRYLAVISATPPSSWADRFVVNINSPRVTFPIALMSTKFNETMEISGRFRSMEEKSFDLKVKMFDAGYEAKKLDLLSNTFAYRNWQAVPERFRIAESRHVARSLAALLESGTSDTTPWDGLAFFSASHVSNTSSGSTTFSNYQSGALAPTVANIQAEMTLMRGVKDENGDKLLVEPDEIWLPTEKFQIVSDLLNQEHLATGESNPIRGRLKIVHVPELTDPNDWYLVDTKLMGMGVSPLIAAVYRPGDTLGLQVWDESSDFYKDTLKLKIKANIWTGFGLVFPHAIRRITGA